MRRIILLITATLFALPTVATPAMAMQPPGKGAQDNFGCVEGSDEPIFGHPGAAGLAAGTVGHAAPRVAGLTGNPSPTAWNAVDRADPMKLGSC